jgi:hypothetical protein
MLISIPDPLFARIKNVLPARQRSKIIILLIEKEIEKREKHLYECALAVEKDDALHAEMNEWDVTLQDGLEDESR